MLAPSSVSLGWPSEYSKLTAQKYMIADANGFPVAFYSSEIHGDSVPSEAIEITVAQWQDLVANQGFRKWVDGEVSAHIPQPQPIPVPTISKAQALLYLLSIGKTDADVKAAIATIPDLNARAVAEIEWNYRQPFHHDHPLFIALGPLLGITDMAAAFRIAATL